MEYKVSVIVPVYNGEKYITRCLDSLLNQSLQEMEIIVVDDGSTDNTFDICKKASEKVPRLKVYHKDNEGQGIARNFGMAKAVGKYIGFVDADDYVELDMYHTLTTRADQYSADWVYSYSDHEEYLELPGAINLDNGIVINTASSIQKMKTILMGGLPDEKNDNFLGMSVWRSIFLLENIKKYNISFLSERIVNSEDLLFNLDYIKHCNTIVTVNKVFYHYCHDNPVSFSVRSDVNRYKMFRTLYEELKVRCDNDEQILRSSRRFLANVRVALVEIARWTNFGNFLQKRTDVKSIIKDPFLQELLRKYPLDKLPKMQKIYFYLMKYSLCDLLILTAKLRYKLL